jgi:hypothetical protein
MFISTTTTKKKVALRCGICESIRNRCGVSVRQQRTPKRNPMHRHPTNSYNIELIHTSVTSLRRLTSTTNDAPPPPPPAPLTHRRTKDGLDCAYPSTACGFAPPMVLNDADADASASTKVFGLFGSINNTMRTIPLFVRYCLMVGFLLLRMVLNRRRRKYIIWDSLMI